MAKYENDLAIFETSLLSKSITFAARKWNSSVNI